MLICTNSLSLQKACFCSLRPQGPLKAFLTVTHRSCSEPQEAVFISAMGPGFRVCRAGQTLETRCDSVCAGKWQLFSCRWGFGLPVRWQLSGLTVQFLADLGFLLGGF